MTKIANIFCILTCLLAIKCYFAESQNLRDLSYGSEVYAPPISTSTVQPTSTTKKSGFFGGIKKLFSRGSTTTETPVESQTPSTPSTTRNSPTPIPINPAQGGTPTPAGSQSGPQTSRDYVNQNIKPGSGIPNSPQGVPSQQGPVPVNSGSFSSTVVTPTPSTRRDYVNPDPSRTQSPSQPSSPTFGIPNGQPQGNSNVGGRRDYVNPNVPSPSSPTQPQTPTGQPQTNFNAGGRRDYVNPNVPNPSSPTQPQTPTGQPQTNFNAGGRRDYVNPNPMRPPSPASSPTSPTFSTPASSSNSGHRDYVNPNFPISSPTTPRSPFSGAPVPHGQSPMTPPGTPTSPGRPVPGSPSSPVLKPEEFPPLPSPGSPNRGRYPTRQPSVTTSTQKTNDLATDEELATLSENLFSKDVNNQNKNIVVNYQGQTRSSETNDVAPQPLLQVQDEVFQSPTVSKMRLLYNNYEMDTTVNEYVTPIERQEENEFVDAVLKTQVMRQAMLFLQNKEIVTPDPKTHKDLLKTIWFTMYSRGGGRIGSSAFEHVFLNEIKNGTITGLHNWIYFFEEERKGHIDYKGYIKKLELGNKGAIVKYRFDYNGIKKPVNAMFIGTSPELEMALYTVCFQVRPDKDCPITMNGNKFIMKTYTFRYRGKNLIGSAFPEI